MDNPTIICPNCEKPVPVWENWEHPQHLSTRCVNCRATISYSSTWDPEVYVIDTVTVEER